MKHKGSGFPSPRSLAKIMKDCQEYSDRSFRDMNKYDNCTIEELSKLVQEKHEQGLRRETDPDAEGFSLNPSSGPASTPLHRSEYEKDLSRMKKIGIKDLQFGRNQDNYIVGELMGIPWRVSNTNSGLNILLKDHHGLVMRCSLQNIIKSENWSEFDALFPEGRKVVILHPFYTRAIDHLPLIRVERREEFYFEDEKKTAHEMNFDILVQQSKKLKEEGNQLLNKDINKALLKYLESILAVLKELPKFANEEKDFLLLWKVDAGESKPHVLEHLAIVLSNCSFAWKQTNKPIKAYYFAQAANFCDPSYFKGYLRKIDALIDLLNFSEAQDTLEFVKKHKDAKQFESTIAKFEYDMHVKMMLYNDSEDMMVRFLRGALKINEEESFVGSIKSFVHPEKGRGYKARTNLKQGDVLIVERGFMNHEENPDFCIKLIDYLDKNAGLKPAYMNLYPSVAFPDKYKPENHGGEQSGFTLLKSMFDMLKYKGKKNWRNFDSEEAGQLLLKTRYNYLRVNDEKLGIFPHVSLINHSCIPNAVWLVIENTIMVYAVRDIPEGEEITIDYAATSILKGDREEKLDFYDIKCQCERCKGEGKWKEMEIKISGFPCKKCGTLTMSKRNSERKCKYTCPKCSETWDLKFVQTAMTKKIEEMGTVPKVLEMGEKFLKKLEKEYGEYSFVRLQAIRWLVRESVNNFDEEKFSVYFKKLASMDTVPSNFRYREILVEAMQSIGVLYDRCPDEKELGCLEKFGLPYSVMRRYWESDIEKDRMPGQALMGSTNLFGKCTCGCEK